MMIARYCTAANFGQVNPGFCKSREAEPRKLCPRQDSNLRPCLRRAVLYPLSYGGQECLTRLAVAARGDERA